MNDETDTQTLVSRAKRGEQPAFEELLARFHSRLEASIRSRLDQLRLRTLEADEILEEVCARAFESLERFEWQGDNAFYRWLSGISRNVILKAARRHRPVDSLEIVRERPAPGPTPSKALRREERLERLEARLRDLSPEHRQVILLARIDGLPLKDVAQRMNRSTPAVKQLLSRALARLRESFGDTDGIHLPDRGLELGGSSDAP